MKTLKKPHQKICIFYGLKPADKADKACDKENAISGANTGVVFTFTSMHITNADVTFCDGSGILTIKTTKQVYKSIWIVLLKQSCIASTWLFIQHRFYTITNVKVDTEIKRGIRKYFLPFLWLFFDEKLPILWQVVCVFKMNPYLSISSTTMEAIFHIDLPIHKESKIFQLKVFIFHEIMK